MGATQLHVQEMPYTDSCKYMFTHTVALHTSAKFISKCHNHFSGPPHKTLMLEHIHTDIGFHHKERLKRKHLYY